MGTRARHRTLSIAVTGDEPPSEFRIFASGLNETTRGTFLFDAAAAKSVMAEYAAHGIDLMLDYDHASLNGGIDPALSGKAAGWFNLDVRGGELWAVNVRWTPPAAEALRRKEWRFMSPAFQTDDAGRVTSVLNVALTNLPATRRLEPLMAANVITLGGCMDPELVKKALDALVAGSAEEAMSILKDMIASAAGAPAEPADDAVIEEMADPVEDDTEEEQAAVVAATSRLVRLTGKSTIGAAVDEVEVWRASHVKLETETVKLAKECAALEYGQRKENAIKLTKLGAETPATTGLAKGKLCNRLLDEPLEEQTARVAMLLAAKGGKLPEPPTPPTGAGGGAAGADGSREFAQTDGRVVRLSARELAMCAEMKIDPTDYAARKPVKKD